MEETTQPTVLVRVITHNNEDEPGWQTKYAWQLAPRDDALRACLSERLFDDTVAEVLEQIDHHGLDVYFDVRVDFGTWGHATLTVLSATGALPRRFFAARHVAERDVILDAVVDDELELRGITTTDVGAGDQLTLAA